MKLVERLKHIITFFLEDMDIRIASMLPPLLAFTIFLAGAVIGNRVYGDAIPMQYTCVIGEMCFLTASLSGLIQVIRKEAPGYLGRKIYGRWAVITGAVWMIFMITLGVILFIASITAM